MDIDLGALENALSSKAKKTRKGSAIKGSKQELFEEAKILAKELLGVYSKKLRTRHQGKTYYVSGDHLRIGYWERVDDINEVPHIVFERLVTNGRKWLKDYHEATARVIKDNPSLALEANLEGKTNMDILQYAEDKIRDEITQLIQGRIKAPGINRIFFRFLVSLSGYPINISGSLDGYFYVDDIDFKPKDPSSADMVIKFINHFEEVKEQINRQIDGIMIKGG
ncbi:MAG: hypothetical protein J7L92_00840 [Dehalococcoidia bacterium]|nr:hypothetical protein [Dehalococcoidia bacterium]